MQSSCPGVEALGQLRTWFFALSVLVAMVAAAAVQHGLGEANPADVEAEIRWRLGFWHNATWCSINASQRFEPDGESIPVKLVLVRPGDDFVYSTYIKSKRRWLNDPHYPTWMAERLATYGVWRFAPPPLAAALESVPVTTGDGCKTSNVLPVLSHCRKSATRWTQGQVLWPGLRHSVAAVFNNSMEAVAADIPWSEKKNVAVWRGGHSGRFGCKGDGTAGPCQPGTASRAHLASLFHNHPLFDVGFSAKKSGFPDKLCRAPLTKGEQLAFKVLISVDGNTCSSILSWALSTRSVVAMVHPFMSEAPVQFALEPWKHFIPFSYDLSDLAINVRWCFDNDADCGQIAEAARQLVARLATDGGFAREAAVQAGMLRRLLANRRECGPRARLGEAPPPTLALAQTAR